LSSGDARANLPRLDNNKRNAEAKERNLSMQSVCHNQFAIKQANVELELWTVMLAGGGRGAPNVADIVWALTNVIHSAKITL
jgi:hypothetical protein